MLHWISPPDVAFCGAAAAPHGPPVPDVPPRARHARMLAHAATRRRAAAASCRLEARVDALYWKASAPQALERARALRESGLCALP
jgi:2-methylisocitrate lyase-like PEP mutase family enzyme